MIINLRNEKEKLVENLIVRIRNDAIKKNFNYLYKLIKNENTLRKYINLINKMDHIIQY